MPFVFLSNGEDVRFLDLETDAHARRIAGSYAQDELERRILESPKPNVPLAQGETMGTTRLTEARVRALRPGKSVREIRDSHLKGFGVRVYPSGRKRYFIHIQHEGRRAWSVVGDASSTRLADARKMARSVMLVTRRGIRPQTDSTLFETVAEEVFRRYGASRWKPGTLKVNRYYLKNQLLPWFKGRQISDISPADVQDWFASLHETPASADRAAPVLSVIMACAETYGYRIEDSNPCKGIKRYRRGARERFLSGDEITRVGVTLQRHQGKEPTLVAIVRLLLLTGCRKTEVVTLRWRDYREGHLHLDDSKVGPRMVWLSTPARRILNGLQRTSSWIFPSARTAGSLTTTPVERFWNRIRAQARLQDVRLHDLRHSYASIAVKQGESIVTIGRLLGHSNAETTLKYTHLSDEGVLEAAQLMGGVLGGSVR